MPVSRRTCVKTPTLFWKVEFPSQFQRYENPQLSQHPSRGHNRENNFQWIPRRHVFTHPGPGADIDSLPDCKHQRHNPWHASPLLHHSALIPESLMIGHHFSASAFTSAPSGDPKSEPPDVWRCYGASVASVAPVLAAAAEMFLGAWQHGIVGEYPVNLYL